jgi:hypothetical protein
MRPDRGQMGLFIRTMFAHAGDKGFVSLRSFEEGATKVVRISPTSLAGGLEFLTDVAEDDADRAANHPKGIVFAPPIATFTNKDHAREADVAEGYALTVECDKHPQEARKKLEALLGDATVVVASGGRWTDPETGETQDKLHLHWRLAVPARGDDRARLKRARELAARLVGGDPSSGPICHPIRWPGSWHRKAVPVMCAIEIARVDVEISLDVALAKLEHATAGLGPAKANGKDHSNGEGEDWGTLVGNIIAGNDLHVSTTSLAAKLVKAGTHGGAAVNLLRGLMESSQAPRDERWDTRLDDVPRAVQTAEKFREAPEDSTGTAADSGTNKHEDSRGQPKPEILLPLPYIDMSHWDEEPPPDPQWGVHNRFPLLQTVLLSGEGAVGKSTIALHLAVIHALGKDWLGTLPEPGPSMPIEAEDGEPMMHRRLADIAKHCGTTFSELIKRGLRPVSLVNEDAVMAAPNRSGKIEPTLLYRRLFKDASELRPKFISIASSANVFAGNESDRSQVQQFIGLLTRLAIAANGYVLLIAHPSLTGITSDYGISGSTQWHNAVRARAYLKGVKADAGEQPDNDLRELVFKKNNYGHLEENVILRYQNGLYLPVPGVTSLDKVARESRAEDVFLALLRRFAKGNRKVGDKPGPSYAPVPLRPRGRGQGGRAHQQRPRARHAPPVQGREDLERAVRQTLATSLPRQHQNLSRRGNRPAPQVLFRTL